MCDAKAATPGASLNLIVQRTGSFQGVMSPKPRLLAFCDEKKQLKPVELLSQLRLLWVGRAWSALHSFSQTQFAIHNGPKSHVQPTCCRLLCRVENVPTGAQLRTHANDIVAISAGNPQFL